MTTYPPILIGLYATLILGAAISLRGWLQVRAFLASYPTIDNQSDLDEFKRVVKSNMFLALAMMAMCAIAIVLATTGIFSGSLGWGQLRTVLFVMGPICTLGGIAITSAESRMKTVKLSDDSLKADFDHAVTRWTSSAFPDW